MATGFPKARVWTAGPPAPHRKLERPHSSPQRLREALSRGSDYDPEGPLSLWNRTHNPTEEPTLQKPRPLGNPHFSINGPRIFFAPFSVKGPRRHASLPWLSQHPGLGGGNGRAEPQAPLSLQSRAPPDGCSARLCPTGTSTAPRATRPLAHPPEPRLPGRKPV